MKLLTSFMLALTLVVNFTGCTSAKNAPPANNVSPGNSDPLVGDYQYSGFDDKGVKLVSGRLTISKVEPRKIGAETQM